MFCVHKFFGPPPSPKEVGKISSTLGTAARALPKTSPRDTVSGHAFREWVPWNSTTGHRSSGVTCASGEASRALPPTAQLHRASPQGLGAGPPPPPPDRCF